MLQTDKNRGFTLIELMVTLAILGVLTAGLLSVVRSASLWRAKQAVREIDAAMSETRAEALSKSSAWIELTVGSDGRYLIATSYADDLVLSDGYTIGYTVEGSPALLPVTAETPLILTYDRSSGGFSDLKLLEADGALSGRGLYCESITIKKGAKSCEIRLYKDTGKHKCGDWTGEEG